MVKSRSQQTDQKKKIDLAYHECSNIGHYFDLSDYVAKLCQLDRFELPGFPLEIK